MQVFIEQSSEQWVRMQQSIDGKIQDCAFDQSDKTLHKWTLWDDENGSD